jgi:hypothetical protein
LEISKNSETDSRSCLYPKRPPFLCILIFRD